VKPAFKGYKPPNCGGEEGYPNTLCVSLNDEVIHGIPSDRTIQEVDAVKLDMGIEKDGGSTTARPPCCAEGSRRRPGTSSGQGTLAPPGSF
jgi:hypothetical protein